MNGSCELKGLKWAESEGEVEQRVAAITAGCESTWDEVAALGSSAADEELTYEAVVAPLRLLAAYKTNPLVCEAKFPQHCSTDPALRAASARAGAAIKQLRRRGRMRSDVFAAVHRFAARRPRLAGDEQHFLEAVLADFRRAGLHLPAAARAQLEELRVRESALCRAYNAAVGRDDRLLYFTREELRGVPDAFFRAKAMPGCAGGADVCCVTLRYADSMPLMAFCSVEGTRRKVMEGRETGYGRNLELMLELVAVRKELAELLGYRSYSHYACERTMVETPEAAMTFLEELAKKLKPQADKEMERLLEVKRREHAATGQPFDGVLYPWDVTYYTQKVAREEYGVDEAELAQYFPLDHVLSQALGFYEKLLGLKFTAVEKGGFHTYHDSVELYEVSDAVSGASVGSFYLDLHPRRGKFAHAALFFVRKRVGGAGPAAVILANFTGGKPGGRPLLRHQEVVTLFHELGHGMHGLCAEGDANMTRLAKCPRDFMEVTSQMLENWCWDPDVLRRLSSHTETGAPLPEALVRRLAQSRRVGGAVDKLHQSFLSYLDLSLHSDPPKGVAEAQERVGELRARFTGMANPEGWNMLRNFCHVTDHYASVYYSYLWSEVIGADIYHTRFAGKGKDPAAVGQEYRRVVLAPGGLVSPMQLVSQFLARPPQQDAFLRQLSSAPEG